MYAIEFQTRLKNGVIEIPHQFLENLKGEVRVILLVDQAAKTTEGFIDQLLAQPVRMKGFRPLTREEVHAR
jgi:hypothetical protein